MTRPARNRLLVMLFIVAAFVFSPRLPSVVTWTAAGVGLPLLFVALWITSPFQRARTLLAKQQFEEAATEIAAFETAVTRSAWKRALASLAIGLYTANPLAAARNTLGAVRLEQGRLDDARTHFAAALAHDPGYAVPWGNLAVLAAMGGDAAGAEEARLKAAALGFRAKVLARVIQDKLAAARR